jgi:prepilin-type processing-associated H-X9-DG protein
MCYLYANEHDDRMPQTLGELAPTEDIELRTFLYPFYNDEVPQPVHPTTQVAIKWVNDNSDYIYLGAGKIASKLTAKDVLAYNKFKYSQKDHLVNVLFGDGHVERIPTADLLKSLSKIPATCPGR